MLKNSKTVKKNKPKTIEIIENNFFKELKKEDKKIDKTKEIKVRTIDQTLSNNSDFDFGELLKFFNFNQSNRRDDTLPVTLLERDLADVRVLKNDKKNEDTVKYADVASSYSSSFSEFGSGAYTIMNKTAGVNILSTEKGNIVRRDNVEKNNGVNFVNPDFVRRNDDYTKESIRENYVYNTKGSEEVLDRSLPGMKRKSNL